MGMFGELQDFPLTELLPLLSTHSGCLTLTQPAQESYLYLHNQQIVHLAAACLPLHATWAMHEHLMGLLKMAPAGTFAFTPLPAAQLPQTVQWPIDWLLLNLIGQDTYRPATADQLPDPETIFVATQRSLDDLPYALYSQLRILAPLLDGRRSLRQIAAALGRDDVLHTVARLRLLGYVQPVQRLATVVHRSGPPSFLQRLAGLLRLGNTA